MSTRIQQIPACTNAAIRETATASLTIPNRNSVSSKYIYNNRTRYAIFLKESSSDCYMKIDQKAQTFCDGGMYLGYKIEGGDFSCEH